MHAKDVAELRRKTGGTGIQCLVALTESNGNIEAAAEILRRALSRTYVPARAPGRIGIAVSKDRTAAIIIEVRLDSDSVAHPDALSASLCDVASHVIPGEQGELPPSDDVVGRVATLAADVKREITFVRGYRFVSPGGVAMHGGYLHHDGRRAAIVQARDTTDVAGLDRVAMHLVGVSERPVAIAMTDLPRELIEKERRYQTDRAMESGREPEIQRKMIDGGMRSFAEQWCLLEQPMFDNARTKVADVLGKKAHVSACASWIAGETDFPDVLLATLPIAGSLSLSAELIEQAKAWADARKNEGWTQDRFADELRRFFESNGDA